MSATTSRRPLPALAFLLVLTVLTAIVWWRVLHRSDASSEAATPTTSATPVATCAKKGTTVALPKPAAVTVDVINAANRDQLATQVSTLLKARGFATGTPTTATTTLAAVGEIRYGSAGKAGASLLGYYVPGAKLVAAKRTDARVDLVLGTNFKALASSTVVTQAVARAKKPC